MRVPPNRFHVASRYRARGEEWEKVGTIIGNERANCHIKLPATDVSPHLFKPISLTSFRVAISTDAIPLASLTCKIIRRFLPNDVDARNIPMTELHLADLKVVVLS
jgi:hypothetical protein